MCYLTLLTHLNSLVQLFCLRLVGTIQPDEQSLLLSLFSECHLFIVLWFRPSALWSIFLKFKETSTKMFNEWNILAYVVDFLSRHVSYVHLLCLTLWTYLPWGKPSSQSGWSSHCLLTCLNMCPYGMVLLTAILPLEPPGLGDPWKASCVIDGISLRHGIRSVFEP